MKAIEKIISLIDTFSELSGRSVAWFAVALTILTGYDTLARYLFQSGSVALQELEWHLFALLFLLAAAYTLKHDAHVRVDLIYAKLTPRGKGIIDVIGTLFLLLPFCVLMIATSWNFAYASYNIAETSGDPGGLPYRWFLKGAITVGFSMLLLQAISMLLNSLLIIIDPTREHEEEITDPHETTVRGVSDV